MAVQPLLDDTIVALATPPGVGALAILRVSGADTFRLVNAIFYGADLTKAPSHTIHLGHIKDEQGRELDEVLTFLFKGPKSYTGEDVIEISTHGSSYIVQEILQLLVRKGARLAGPGEFTLRAFMHGRLDLTQAEAVADLIASENAAAHAIAVQQMRGGFSSDIKHLRQELIDFAALIELELDFVEEDVEFADRIKLRNLIHKILQYIDNLTRSFQLGNAIKEGVSAVIAGRPNAGKSTLLNSLLNEDRAIVSEIAGTTRDTIEEAINIRGIKFRLIDTAGIREAQDQLEAIGVSKTLQKIEQSNVLIYVFDVAQLSRDELLSDLQSLARPDLHLLVVANKMDLNPYQVAEEYYQEELVSATNFIPISARHHMNVTFLKDKLYELVVKGDLKLEHTVVTNVRHLEALQQSAAALRSVLGGLEQNVTHDFLTTDIRQALHHLGTITGEIGTEDLLDSIFSRFCIGK